MESIGLDSSDEERAEEEQEGGVTSMDEALRKVSGSTDHSQEDFLKQNFERLAESCTLGMRGH